MTARAASPRAETRILAAPAELRSWARQALAGECIDYAEGPWVPDGPTKAEVTALQREGIATPHQRRTAAGVAVYYLKLRPPSPKPAAQRGAAAPAPVLDEGQAAVLEALVAAARAGARCPSDRALAETAGLGSRHQASWRVRKLAEAGLIGIETQSGPDGPWRVVIVGGCRTAGPPAKAVRA